MPADVVLVNPSYVYPPMSAVETERLRDDPLWMDLPSAEFLYPPMGLLYVADALVQAGFSVELIDSNLTPSSLDALARRCEGAKVVGISLLVANLRSTYQMVRHMKGRGFEIVVGGAYPSVTPEVVEQLGIRYGISGEGEVPFVDLVRSIVHGEGKPEDIPGIIIHRPGKPLYTTHPDLLRDLDRYRPYRRAVRRKVELRAPKYKLPFAGGIEVALTSRGCPYKCTFCYCSSASPNSMFNTSRWVSIETAVDDFRSVVDAYGPSYIEMVDETFTVKRGFVEDFCHALIDTGLANKVQWGAKTRVDLMDTDLLELMKRAGLRKIGFGLESGVYDHRKAMQKDFGNDKVREVFGACNELNVDSACTIIFGHPDETRADMQTSVDLVKEIQAAYVEFHIMVLIPKTKLFDTAVAEGKVTHDVFERFMRGECEYPEYAPGDITPEEMRAIHRKAIREFYFRPAYIREQLGRVREIRDVYQYAKAARALFDMTDLRRPVWAVGRAALGA